MERAPLIEEVLRKWKEWESVVFPVVAGAATLVVIVAGQVAKMFRSRKAEEALEVAREAHAVADRSLVIATTNERRVSEIYGIVLSLQNDMAAMSRDADKFAQSAAQVMAIAEQLKTAIKRAPS